MSKTFCRILFNFLIFISASASLAEARVEQNVLVGMVSGLALLMDVHYPENPNGFGIIHVSGSGWTRPLSFNAQPLSESQVEIFGAPLVEKGYTVFSLNHRAVPKFQFPDPLLDIQRSVRYVRYNAEKYGIDPDRIGAVGGSSGGHLISLLATLGEEGNPEDPDPINRESSRVQTVVARAAPFDLTKMGHSLNLSLLLGARLVDDTSSQETRRYIDASPVTYLSSDDPPMLLIHGDKDQIVPYEQSLNFLSKLRQEGIPSKLITIPGAGHGPSFPGAINPPNFIEEMVTWFNEHLRQ